MPPSLVLVVVAIGLIAAAENPLPQEHQPKSLEDALVVIKNIISNQISTTTDDFHMLPRDEYNGESYVNYFTNTTEQLEAERFNQHNIKELDVNLLPYEDIKEFINDHYSGKEIPFITQILFEQFPWLAQDEWRDGNINGHKIIYRKGSEGVFEILYYGENVLKYGRRFHNNEFEEVRKGVNGWTVVGGWSRININGREAVYRNDTTPLVIKVKFLTENMVRLFKFNNNTSSYDEVDATCNPVEGKPAKIGNDNVLYKVIETRGDEEILEVETVFSKSIEYYRRFNENTNEATWERVRNRNKHWEVCVVDKVIVGEDGNVGYGWEVEIFNEKYVFWKEIIQFSNGRTVWLVVFEDGCYKFVNMYPNLQWYYITDDEVVEVVQNISDESKWVTERVNGNLLPVLKLIDDWYFVNNAQRVIQVVVKASGDWKLRSLDEAVGEIIKGVPKQRYYFGKYINDVLVEFYMPFGYGLMTMGYQIDNGEVSYWEYNGDKSPTDGDFQLVPTEEVLNSWIPKNWKNGTCKGDIEYIYETLKLRNKDGSTIQFKFYSHQNKFNIDEVTVVEKQANTRPVALKTVITFLSEVFYSKIIPIRENGKVYHHSRWEKRKNGDSTEYWKLKLRIKNVEVYMVIRPDNSINFIQTFTNKPGQIIIGADDFLKMLTTIKSEWNAMEINGHKVTAMELLDSYGNGEYFAVNNADIPEIWMLLNGVWQQYDIYTAIDHMIKPRLSEKWLKIEFEGIEKFVIPIETTATGKIFFMYKNKNITFWNYTSDGWRWDHVESNQVFENWVKTRWLQKPNGEYIYDAEKNDHLQYFALFSTFQNKLQYMQNETLPSGEVITSEITQDDFMTKILLANQDLVQPYRVAHPIFESNWTPHGTDFRRMLLRMKNTRFQIVYHENGTYSFLQTEINSDKEQTISNEDFTNYLLQAAGIIITPIISNGQLVQTIPITHNIALSISKETTELYEGNNKISLQQAIQKVKTIDSNLVRKNDAGKDTIVIPIRTKDFFYRVYLWFRHTYYNNNAQLEAPEDGDSFIIINEKPEFVFINKDIPKKVDFKMAVNDLTRTPEDWLLFDDDLYIPIDTDDDGTVFLAYAVYEDQVEFWKRDVNNNWNQLDFYPVLAKWIANKWDRHEINNKTIDTLIVTTIHHKNDPTIDEFTADYDNNNKTISWYKIITNGTETTRNEMTLKEFMNSIVQLNRQKIRITGNSKWLKRVINEEVQFWKLITRNGNGLETWYVRVGTTNYIALQNDYLLKLPTLNFATKVINILGSNEKGLYLAHTKSNGDWYLINATQLWHEESKNNWKQIDYENYLPRKTENLLATSNNGIILQIVNGKVINYSIDFSNSPNQIVDKTGDGKVLTIAAPIGELSGTTINGLIEYPSLVLIIKNGIRLYLTGTNVEETNSGNKELINYIKGHSTKSKVEYIYDVIKLKSGGTLVVIYSDNKKSFSYFKHIGDNYQQLTPIQFSDEFLQAADGANKNSTDNDWNHNEDNDNHDVEQNNHNTDGHNPNNDHNMNNQDKNHDNDINTPGFNLGGLIHIGMDGIRVCGYRGVNVSPKGIKVGNMVKINLAGLFGGVFNKQNEDLFGPPGINVMGKLVHVGPDGIKVGGGLIYVGPKGINIGNIIKFPFGGRVIP